MRLFFSSNSFLIIASCLVYTSHIGYNIMFAHIDALPFPKKISHSPTAGERQFSVSESCVHGCGLWLPLHLHVLHGSGLEWWRHRDTPRNAIYRLSSVCAGSDSVLISFWILCCLGWVRLAVGILRTKTSRYPLENKTKQNKTKQNKTKQNKWNKSNQCFPLLIRLLSHTPYTQVNQTVPSNETKTFGQTLQVGLIAKVFGVGIILGPALALKELHKIGDALAKHENKYFPQTVAGTSISFIYFSFVIITTTGFGGLVPTHLFSRLLVSVHGRPVDMTSRPWQCALIGYDCWPFTA